MTRPPEVAGDDPDDGKDDHSFLLESVMRALRLVVLSSVVVLGACSAATDISSPSTSVKPAPARYDETPTDSTGTCKSGYTTAEGRC